MLGAIIGDIIGSVYEHWNTKRKDFQLFSNYSRFTDDSVLTIAVAEAIMFFFEYDEGSRDLKGEGDQEKLSKRIYSSLRNWGMRYPHAGYGGTFSKWIRYGGEPYNSWGNGSAMRVSATAWLFDDLETVRKAAAITAAVTHNHPEGMKGAEAIASATYLARTGSFKPEIKEYIEREFQYDLERTCDEIRPKYTFDVSCQGSVPEAIIAFLDGRDFEDVIRNAVSLGGDSDTIAAMAGAIAEAYYGADKEIAREAICRLENDQRRVLQSFEEYRPERINRDEYDPVDVAGYRIGLLPEDEQEIARYYVESKNIYKTAEAFGMDAGEVIKILHKAEKYMARKYREGCDVVEYINELSPGALTKGKGIPFNMVCGTWIKSRYHYDDELIIDILSTVDSMPDIEELCRMTGIHERYIRHTLSRIRQQNNMYEGIQVSLRQSGNSGNTEEDQ